MRSLPALHVRNHNFLLSQHAPQHANEAWVKLGYLDDWRLLGFARCSPELLLRLCPSSPLGFDRVRDIFVVELAVGFLVNAVIV